MSTPAGDAVLMQDYVAGRLSQSECEAFEARLLTDAGLVRDLEESLRFREGLEMLREQGALESQQRPRRRRLFAGARWAAAAAAVFIAVFAALQWGDRYLGERPTPLVAASIAGLQGGSSPAPKVAERYAFATMREAASTPELTLPTSGALELRALTAVTDASQTFGITLSQMQNQKPTKIGSVAHVVPDADGFVVIYADASRLEPGDYSLSVEPEGARNEPGSERFAFRLKRD